jgi:hypothetical protein
MRELENNCSTWRRYTPYQIGGRNKQERLIGGSDRRVDKQKQRSKASPSLAVYRKIARDMFMITSNRSDSISFSISTE